MKQFNRPISNYVLVFTTKPRTSIINLLAIFSLISVATMQEFVVMVSPSSSSQINQLADYIVGTGPSNVVGYDILADSILLVTFPPQYNVTLLRSRTYTGYSSANVDQCFFDIDTACPGVTVAFSGNSFAISGLFPSPISSAETWWFQYTIFSIQNPNKLSVAPFAVTIFKGTAISYPPTGQTSDTIFLSSFLTQEVTYTVQVLYPTIWSISPLKFVITPNNVIDSITIKFPNTWSGQTHTNTAALTSSVTVSSVSNPSITIINMVSYYLINNLYYYTASQPIDLTINSIYNPSSLQPAGSIILSLLSSGTVLETSTFAIPAASFTNDILRNLATTLTYQASDKIQVQLSFQFSEFNSNSDKIYITFPSELTIPTLTSSYSIKMATVVVSPAITIDSAANTVSFNVSSGSIYQIAVSVTITGIVRPRECKSTSNFTIKTSRLNLYLMDSSTCCSLQLANRQSLLINSIILSNSHHLQTAVTYTFNFSTSVVNLVTTDNIQIIFPPEYSGFITSARSAALCASLNIAGINFAGKVKTPTCNIYMNSLVISSFLSSSETGSETFVVALPGVTNPSASPTTGFVISTLSAANYVLEQSQNYTITIQPNTFTTFSVDTASKQTCTPNNVYTFTLGNNAALSNGYTIIISFPPDFTFVSYNSLQCTINGVVFACARDNSTYHTKTIRIVISVNTLITTITSVAISSITNPISQAQTGSFSAVIKDQTGTTVESSSGVYTVQMTSSGTFTLFTATAANYSAGSTLIEPSVQFINSVSNSIWITMVLPFSPLVTPSSLLIIINNANRLQYSVLSSCSSSQITSLCTISNNIGTNNMQISYSSLTFASLNTNFLQVQIAYLVIYDYQNIQITATFSVNGFSSVSLATPAKISKIYVETVSNYGVALSSQILGQASTATLTITLSSEALSQLSYFIVYVPQQFGTASRTLNIPSSNFISSQLTITGLTNPTVENFTPFLFSAYNANNNVIAISTPTNPAKVYGFNLACTLPCRTCSSATVCIDCYTTISWISKIYLQNSTLTCVAQCASGQYLSSGICYPCSATCLTCLIYGGSFSNGNSTYCLTCASPKLLYGTTCVSECPTGYYSSQSVCEPCMMNCLNCTSPSTCTSCQNFYSLYSNQCILTCPSSTVSFTTIATSQSACISCPSDCLSCTSAASPQCLSCSSGLYLYNGQCVADCLVLSLYQSYQMTCAACQCLSCVNFAYNCISCANPYSLYNNQCLVNCPTGYYSQSNICQTCMANCLSCTSASYCSLCQIPYALYIASLTSASCLLTCPVNTIATIDATNFIYTCQGCGGNCQTCNTSVTFCLSCKTGFVLNNNTCVASCPVGLWLIGGTCAVCAPVCQVCTASDPYNCSLCSPNYFYSNYSCNASCPVGTYADISTLKCLVCNIKCSACVNLTNCTSCQPTYFLYNSFCYSNCVSINPAFYSFNGTCSLCQPQCTLCLSTPVQCTSCVSTSYYFNPVDKSCSFGCTAPYYINETYCSLCQSPCSTCDTLYNSCLSCLGSLNVWNGKCYASCPSGYYSLNNVCLQCASACLTCTSTECLTCQPYAYRYFQTCILDCSTSTLPITIQSYCTSCAEVPYCQTCQLTVSSSFACFVCIYPYVIFEGNCLNKCPNLYAIDSTNTCVPTPAYSAYIDQLYIQNYPKLPPFCFFGIFLVFGAALVYISNKQYMYTYHYGYLIALVSVIQLIFLAYGCRYIAELYLGDYTNQNKLIPLFILGGSLVFKIMLSASFTIYVIGCYYLKDVRFKQWKQQNERGFKVSIILTLIFSSRFFKLYYSKFVGKPLYSYRIVSVQKFYYEDIITWISIVPDIADIAAVAIINYNIFITYAVLYFLSFELLLFKGVQWFLLAGDLKKPDRGFFLGDEEDAERMIREENEALEKEKRKFEMESLVKLIRRKSAGNLHYEKLYQHIFFDDFRSVYDPSDYEDVPIVPKRKIEKNIDKGRFRKGKRISIEQKLKRFAQSIKPTPVVSRDDGYLKNLLYWKPPKQLKVTKKEAPSQSHQSMMKLLEDKQLYYQDVSNFQVIDLDQISGIQRNDMPSRFQRRKRTGFGIDGEETVVNDTFQIYDPSSIEFLEPEDNDVNGFWNKNYARKQHLPQNIASNRYDDNDLRVLYHQPLKKRRAKLNEIRSRHY